MWQCRWGQVATPGFKAARWSAMWPAPELKPHRGEFQMGVPGEGDEELGEPDP